jgi:hypothetical protein
MQHTHVTIELPGLIWQTVPIAADSTVDLIERNTGSNDYKALLIDGLLHYELVMCKHLSGRPELCARLQEALTLVQGAIDALNTPPAPVGDSDAFIAAALEEFVTETQTLLDAALAQKPADADVRDEIKFWRAQRNAFVKAQHYFGQGVRLTQTPSGYTVPSASRPGALVHCCYKVGDIWACSCEAGEKGFFHWHTALIHAVERGLELARLAAKPPPPSPILVSTSQAGLCLSRDGRTQVAPSPADVATAIGRVAKQPTPAQLGQRLALARSAR